MTSGIEEIALRLCRELSPSRVLVAIDGPDGSGKTTFAHQLARQLEASDDRRTRR